MDSPRIPFRPIRPLSSLFTPGARFASPRLPSLTPQRPLLQPPPPGTTPPPGDEISPPGSPNATATATSPAIYRPTMTTTHQVRAPSNFSGSDSRMRLEDWIVEVGYVLDPSMSDQQQAKTIERYLSGDARLAYKSMLVDNPQPTAVQIFMELRTWFGDVECHQDPMAAFYDRIQKPQEYVLTFALSLDEILQQVETKTGRCPDRDFKLIHQFLKGLRDEKLKDQLRTMRAHTMTFRQVMSEVRRLLRDKQQPSQAVANAHVAEKPHHKTPKLTKLEDTVREQSKQIQAMQDMLQQLLCNPPPQQIPPPQMPPMPPPWYPPPSTPQFAPPPAPSPSAGPRHANTNNRGRGRGFNKSSAPANRSLNH